MERILAAEFLAGGQRHLDHFPSALGERFPIKGDLIPLIKEVAARYERQRCVVLATGDPLFYGIGAYLAGILGRKLVRVEPARSSMQLAFARVGLPWGNATLSTVHGRPLRPWLLPLLGKLNIGLFTQDGDSPAAVARFFVQHGLDGYEAFVAENLGTPEERLTYWKNLNELAGQQFAPLNYLVLRATQLPVAPVQVERNRALVPGIPDEAFARPEAGPEVMTRQEVRSVAVGKLSGQTLAGDTAWDIGAGLGTVSVELAVLRPELEVIAVERDPTRAVLLRENRGRFGAYNIRIVVGEAPDALAGEPEPPRYVFLGGSGGRLEAVLDLVARRLIDEGRLVAAFVTLEHLGLALQRLRTWRWPFEVTEVGVSRSDHLAGLTGLKPQRSVFLVRADKPAADAPRGREQTHG
jgi:precorrin-6Y C5,15-methyltransferase (decarboxylating)